MINERLDLNGDGAVTGADDSNAFYGDTAIIDGGLDCDAWGLTENEGSAGDGVIDVNDDCFLRVVDGTNNGVLSAIDARFGPMCRRGKESKRSFSGVSDCSAFGDGAGFSSKFASA